MNLPTDAELDRFASTAPREIIYNLQRLIHDGERITVTFGEGSEGMLTVLLDVDEAQGVLYFDWGGAESVNRRLLAAERVNFVAAPHGIRNQFVCGKVWQAEYKKRPAFVTRLPTRYVRLQRREFFRLALPLTRRLTCRFTHPDGRTVALPVSDIGIGGVGIEQSGLDLALAAGTLLDGGHLDLDAHARIDTRFELRYQSIVQHGGKHLTRVGLAFHGTGAAQEVALQKYLTAVQKDMRARGL